MYSFLFFSELALPVFLSIDSMPVVSPKVLQNVCRFLSKNMALLNKDFVSGGMKCVVVSGISLQKNVLSISFVFDNLETLNEFKQLSNKGRISQCFTEYSWIRKLETKAGRKVKFFLEMDNTAFVDAKSDFERKRSSNIR